MLLSSWVQLEQAYDRILQQQLAARLRGELPVSSKVRFADVPQRRPAPRPVSGYVGVPACLMQLPLFVAHMHRGVG